VKLIKTFFLMNVCMGLHGELKIGDRAPNFSLKDETGTVRTLSEFKEKRLVLFFYPKDGTANCTKEACALRDSSALFAQHDIEVLGVSYDSPGSHLDFKQKYNLPFSLLSDSDRQVARAYGLGSSGWWSKITNHFFPDRITFLIDKRIIVGILKKVNIAAQAEDIIQGFGIE